MRLAHRAKINETSLRDVIECDRLSALDLTISEDTGKDDVEEGRKEILEEGQGPQRGDELQRRERECDAAGAHEGMQASEIGSRCIEQILIGY